MFIIQATRLFPVAKHQKWDFNILQWFKIGAMTFSIMTLSIMAFIIVVNKM
jgi:hypothetical protein